MTTTPKANEFTITRFYEAPVKAVWDAWTDPKQVEKWWGPRGFTLTTHSKDLRPGGHWDYTMHGPDGKDYENSTKYHEVVKHEKLVYDHGGFKDRPPLFRATALFKAVKGGTILEITMALKSPEAAAEIKAFIKKAGGNATWDRLGEHLAKETADRDVFVINRSFEAPLAQVFELWTDPERVSQWLPPAGFSMKCIRADIRPGGTMFYSMTADNGSLTLHGRMEYLTIEKPRALVYQQEFCDEKENLSRHPLLPAWPPAMRTTVTFTEESPGATRVSVTWEAHGDVKPDELEVFRNFRPSMTQGWTGSFDKLEAYLSESFNKGR